MPVWKGIDGLNKNTMRKKRRAVRELLKTAGADGEVREIRLRAEMLREYAQTQTAKERNKTLSFAKEREHAADTLEGDSQKAKAIIYGLPEPARSIMVERYIRLKKWDDIAKAKHYSRETLAYHERVAVDWIIKRRLDK